VLSLAIAGLRVELRCNDQRLTDQLQARYRQYLAPGTPHLTADVHWSCRSHSGYLADASMTFADGTPHLAAPGYDGAVDAKQGRAWLRLSSTVGGGLPCAGVQTMEPEVEVRNGALSSEN